MAYEEQVRGDCPHCGKVKIEITNTHGDGSFGGGYGVDNGVKECPECGVFVSGTKGFGLSYTFMPPEHFIKNLVKTEVKLDEDGNIRAETNLDKLFKFFKKMEKKLKGDKT